MSKDIDTASDRPQSDRWKIQAGELGASYKERSSAAEELETRKEELKSVSQELATVNQALEIRIDELSRTNNDRHEQVLEGERAARIAAEGATLLRDEFLATLSHEMRTPLSVITSWSQLLESKFAEVDPQLRRGLAVIGSSAFALSQLISDLLDIARMQAGKLILDLAAVDLREITAAAVQALRPDAERKNVTLTFSSDLDAALVHADRMRLQQVFWNLISNAIKFTAEGASIDVTLALRDPDYEISVHDTGAGIPVGFAPRVFERFSQADSSSSRGYAGLGIGLALVKEIVELHGGSVAAASSSGSGNGSTFVVRLPIWAP